MKKFLTISWFISLLLLGMNFFIWQNAFFDIVFFSLYVIVTAVLLARFLKWLLCWSAGWSLIFAFFNLFFLFSFFLAVFVDFYKLTDYFIYLSLALVGFFICLLNWRWSDNLFIRNKFGFDLLGVIFRSCDDKVPGIKIQKILLLLFPFFLVLGWYLLTSARTGEYILTPWQVVPKVYIYIFLLVTFTVILLIFSRLKTGVILFIIILHSFLLHAYLPSVYQTGFGGDKWRHLASEKVLAEEKIYSPVLFGGEVSYVNLGPLKVPEVLVAGNKTSYGNQWGITIALSKFLHLDEFWIDYFLVFILWSFIIPLLLYKFAELIWKQNHFGLLLAFLPSLFYTFQVFGSITIPVSWGHLFFFWVLYLWLRYLQNSEKKIRNVALVLSGLMYLGYILNFLLIMEVAVAVLLKQGIKNSKIRKVSLILIFLAGLAAIPLLEMVMGYGSFKDGIMSFRGFFNALADAFGSLSGLIAFIPRPIHIDQGNWLYNQTRLTQSHASLLSLGIMPFVFTLIIWGLIILSLEKIRNLKDNIVVRFLGGMLMVVLFNYIFSWYFMTGNHILARRLDLTIVWLLLVFLALGIFYVLKSTLSFLNIDHKKMGLAALLALVATSTYASGPVLEVVTSDEVKAANYVWQEIDRSSGDYCVVANTWPLLALEAASEREIVAGGFPVYLEYAQPERVKIFEGLLKWPRKQNYFADAFSVTKASECWYMLERKWVSDKVWADTVGLFGEPDKIIGKVNIWRIKPGLVE